jgi:hypothetical protein
MKEICKFMFLALLSVRFSRQYDTVLATLQSRPLHLDGLFLCLFIIYKGKRNSHSDMDTVSFHVASELIWDTSILTASNCVTSSPSATCLSAANSTGQFLDDLIGVELLWRNNSGLIIMPFNTLKTGRLTWCFSL